ncbi:RNA polymerase sigma factor [Chitinophaga sp. S165]|uniref:RNA polymerase sigma factor n=1 Tax=Chitinophaga sp. S165 TaxID=2135462 RepID=UPI000D71171F|nr:RNA polymerase sigma-70 factor [Chitinophaga sp. S165]PWV56141.1 RNA polymerase sigma-70 factor (ECF subfamily) [Chitinophaga sp. S165]
MPDQPDNEKILLQRIREGAQDAFKAIYARYNEKIYSLAYHLTRSEVVAEEIVQDVFLKVWMQKETLPEIRDFESWLFILARNYIYTWLKTSARRQAHEMLADDHVSVEPLEVDAAIHRKELENLLREAIRQLSPQQQQVYILFREEQLTREAIAGRLGLSSETVKVHMSRAMRSIRAYITSRTPFTLILFFLLKNLLLFFPAM